MHSHDHHHAHGPSATKVLRISLLVTFAYIALLVFAGIKADSLALLSEAGHNVSDFIALLLSLTAVYFQRRPPSKTKTFGYHRAGVLAAFVNAASLVFVSFYIFYEAFKRLQRPEHVEGSVMMWVAGAGVLMNGLIALMIWRSNRGSDVNLRSVFLHEIGDTLSTLAVLIGGWAIGWTGQVWIDPALSVGIGALIMSSSFGIIRETLNILLEGTPGGMQVERIADEIESVPGVNYVHDLHVWTIGSGMHALSCHVGIEDIPPSESGKILTSVQARIAERFHIHHTTIQFEHMVCDVANGCVIPVSHVHPH